MKRPGCFIKKDDGFTLMETLVTLTVTLIISGSIIFAFAAAMKSASKANGSVSTATTMLKVDRFIREQTAEMHIPYWTYSERPVEELKNRLWRSNMGEYIREIQTVTDGAGRNRGIRVQFEVAGKQARTEALFSSIPVVGRKR